MIRPFYMLSCDECQNAGPDAETAEEAKAHGRRLGWRITESKDQCWDCRQKVKKLDEELP